MRLDTAGPSQNSERPRCCRATVRAMEASLYFAALALASLFSLFWIIRLGVRYGVDDAIQMNSDLLRSRERS